MSYFYNKNNQKLKTVKKLLLKCFIITVFFTVSGAGGGGCRRVVHTRRPEALLAGAGARRLWWDARGCGCLGRSEEVLSTLHKRISYLNMRICTYNHRALVSLFFLA